MGSQLTVNCDPIHSTALALSAPSRARAPGDTSISFELSGPSIVLRLSPRRGCMGLPPSLLRPGCVRIDYMAFGAFL
eukprot:52982-Pyramimonas_sp.AAC.1